MKDYLESLAIEQINRSQALKKLITYPLKYPELGGLAERCTLILENQVSILNELREELHARDDDLRDIFREIRVSARDISFVEYYGIPALYHQTREGEFLNKLMFKIHQEIGLPFNPPSICCTSTEHYFSNLFTNVIFVPLCESAFLLHLPDLYHELGHCVLANMETVPRLEALKHNYFLAFWKVTDYYNQLLRRKRQEGAPEGIVVTIERIHSLWKSWIREFFCDLFALYTVGPAYAWSHLHLTIKRSDDIYELSVLEKQTHPSDESRMRILIYGLENLGFREEVKKVRNRWSELAKFWETEVDEYQYAYPESLLKDIANLTLDGLRQSAFCIAYHGILEETKANGIRGMFNKAWQVFWSAKPEEFRDWEERCMANLRETLSQRNPAL